MTKPPHPLTQLQRLAETTLHITVTITTPALTHATGTVARLRAGDTDLIGKIHRTPALHQREVHAYRTWTPHLGDAVPRLVAVAPELPGIVITAVPGAPLDTLSLSAAEEREAHRAAGRILRRLHALPNSTPAEEIARYLATRGEHWLSQLTSHLTRHDTDLVREHLHQLSSLTIARVAACHLDFQPRNLLWHTDHQVRVIDFENSREDLAARDLARLATRTWPHRPDLKTAFLDGYGPLDTTDTAVLHHVTALEAVTSLAYGLRTRDSHLVHIGQGLLAELR
ncbi:phosphotransferase enzyme family protein [Amycolatopsis palatopharyngis]|uniref:phosphotransferase enzyme family protein n=1 Tax=Amycolatopsis palatopharyngis TaxID=187982 RepID=UPI000E22DC8D|nr:aminoglycoside phosphotransferase family protein [Amycolatopsis palatopharyngis]